MRTLFRGGTLVGADGTRQEDLLIDGERIAAVGQRLPDRDAAVVDAGGLLLLPGGIDVHTHLDMPLGERTTADDFASGYVAAAFGGTTSHLDFAIQPRGATLREALDLWHASVRCARHLLSGAPAGKRGAGAGPERVG